MEGKRASEERTPAICDYEGSNYQESFWDQGQRDYEDRVEAIALKRLLPGSGKRMLELGAGAGRNTPRYGGYSDIVLLDYSRTQLARAQAALGDVRRYRYVAADVYRLPFAQGVFDGATMIRTLHHMAEPIKALKQVRAAMAQAGIFILEYANKRNIKSILRWLIRRQDWNPFELDPIEFVELNFDFHPAAVRTWLAEAGFKLERELTVSHFRQEWLKRTVPTSILVGADSLAQWTGDLWQLSPSVFTRSRAVGEPGLSSGAFWKCPACQSTLMEEVAEGVHCQTCDLLWPKVEGIYDFKIHLRD